MHRRGWHLSRARRLTVGAVMALLAAAALTAVALGATSITEISGSPFVTGSVPLAVAYSPDGSRLAIVNDDAASVSTYAVAAGGALSPSGGVTSPDDHDPQTVAYSPDGSFIATGNNSSGTFSIYVVGSDGTLSPGGLGATDGPVPISGSGSDPLGVAFSPNNQYLAVAASGLNQVVIYSVSQKGSSNAGQLSAVGSYATGTSPVAVAFSPNGGLLAVANRGSNSVSLFRIATSGTLSALNTVPTGAGPAAIAFSPDGGVLATANQGANNVSAFTVSSSGGLSPAPNSPFTTGQTPVSIAFAPTGNLLATANAGASTVSMFSYDATGALTQVSGSPVSAGASPSGVAFNPGGGTFTVVDANENHARVFAYGTTTPVTSTMTAAPTTTVAPTTTTTTTTPAPAPSPSAVATIVRTKVTGAVAAVTIGCSSSTGTACSGKVALTSHVARKTVAVGSVAYYLAAGKTATVHARLNATGRKLLAQTYSLTATAIFTGTIAGTRSFHFAYPRITAPVSSTWRASATYSAETQLVIGQLPKGATITVTCHGGGCPYAKRAYHSTSTSFRLTGLLARVHLRPHATLALTISAPNSVAEVVTYTIRAGSRTPTLTHRCQAPGARKPALCRASPSA